MSQDRSLLPPASSLQPPASSRAKRQSGVTLVELVISIVVISIAVSAVLGVFTFNARNSADAMVYEQATAIASSYLEEITLKPYHDADADGETARADFDDVNDYDGLNDNAGARDQFGNLITGLSPYQVAVSVGAGTLGALSSGVYRIDVTVTHTTGLTLRLSGYRADY